MKSSGKKNLSKLSSGEYTIHKPFECRQILDNKPIHLKRCTYDGKEITRVIEKGGYRKLLVPSKEPMVHPKIIKSSELQALLDRCHHPSKEEKEKSLTDAEHEKERLIRESMARKDEIRRMDLQKSKAKEGRLSDIEQEARARTMHLLERANKLQLEQEEEIKICNKIILETKCRAIRDAQVEEKKLLAQERTLEEQRCNELMEQDRINALREEEYKEKERAQRQMSFSETLKKQIRENEEERLIEYERKREESRLVNLKNLTEQETEMEKFKEKELEHKRARQAFIELNEQLKHIKQVEKEEDRIMDIRIQEYNKSKAERDARIAQELHQECMRKEREKERVAEHSRQANDLQAQIDELNAARIQEEVEREWRKKEKDEAIRQAENLQKLRESRNEQINRKMHLQAMEIERERQEFEKILKLQKEAVCRDQKELEKKHRKAMIHRSEILKQVNEKEKIKIMQRQKMFEEGLAINAETEMRKKKLRDAMQNKLQEMKDSTVPEMYISEVKRMIENI